MGTNFSDMTTTEKIEAIKAIGQVIPELGTFSERLTAIAKVGEIIATFDPSCKCKATRESLDFVPTFTCNTTVDRLSLPIDPSTR